MKKSINNIKCKIKYFKVLLLLIMVALICIYYKNNKSIKAADVVTDDYEFNPSTGNLLIKTQAGLTNFSADTNINQNDVTSLSFADDMTSVNGVLVDHLAYFNKCQISSINWNNVTSVGSYAFKGCSYLENLDLSQITSIGEGAFQSCTKVQTVEFSNSLASIPERAFMGCSALDNLNLKNVVSVGKLAFECNYNLKTVDFGKVETIGDLAFCSDSQLNNIDLSGVTTFGPNAFQACINLSNATFPSTATYGTNSFWVCGFELYEGYPSGATLDAFRDQVPPYCCSLSKYTDTIKIGDSFTPPTVIVKTRSGKDYQELINEMPEWLCTDCPPSVIESGDKLDNEKEGIYNHKYNVTNTRRGVRVENGNLSFTLTVKGDEPIVIDKDAAITPDEAIFNKDIGDENYKDIIVSLDSGTYTFNSISNNGKDLIQNTDYTKTDNQFAIKKEYLSSFSIGDTVVLNFNMSGGKTPELKIIIIQNRDISPSVEPAMAVYDKNPKGKYHKTLIATLNVAMYDFVNISDDLAALIKDEDYIEQESKKAFYSNDKNNESSSSDTNSSQIMKNESPVLKAGEGYERTFEVQSNYLNKLKEGNTILTFNLNGGTSPIINLLVIDTTSSDSGDNHGGNDSGGSSDNNGGNDSGGSSDNNGGQDSGGSSDNNGGNDSGGSSDNNGGNNSDGSSVYDKETGRNSNLTGKVS
ncbi:MAG: leucine-rich repeat protein, partial [Lachnospiraceae bacterium]|nr:leucine-rich repeat protein [Lachnospiraceae bacterium]